MNNNIKSMKLYKSTDRFLIQYYNLKKQLKRIPNTKELSSFDHMHYDGINSVNVAIKKIKIEKSSIVLDIGSGIGGPARYINQITNAKVYAIELQKNLNDMRFSNL